MTNAIGGKVEDMVAYFSEARDAGIQVLGPDVNESGKQFTVLGKTIRFGLGAIKNVGEAVVENIVKTRDEGGPFRSFEDFCTRVDSTILNSRTLDCLIKSGSFDSLGYRRSQLVDAQEQVLALTQARQKEKERGQASLFDVFDDISAQQDPSGSMGEGNGGDHIVLRDIPEMDDRIKLQLEKELIGYFVSGHPMDIYISDMESLADCTIAQLARQEDGSFVMLVGMISRILPKTDKNNRQMAFVDLSDMDATVETVFFSDSFEKNRSLLSVDQMVALRGRVQERNGDKKILANDVWTLDQVREKWVELLEVKISPEAAGNGVMEKIAAAVKKSPGKKPVRLGIAVEDKEELRINLPEKARVTLTDNLIKNLKSIKGVQQVKFQKAERQ
jgi:DNA polymerase-3 subunit alpha